MTRETNSEILADIAREMRTYFQAQKRNGNPEHRPWHKVLSDWADRIEAAVKRERVERHEYELAECERCARANSAAMRAALVEVDTLMGRICDHISEPNHILHYACKAGEVARAALAAPARKGKWKNGTDYEYEYAYCSECGRMQWAGWDTHKQAEENIESFAANYRYCPGCGTEMEGGVYVK